MQVRLMVMMVVLEDSECDWLSVEVQASVYEIFYLFVLKLILRKKRISSFRNQSYLLTSDIIALFGPSSMTE